MRLKHWFYTVPLRLRSLLRRDRAELFRRRGISDRQDIDDLGPTVHGDRRDAAGVFRPRSRKEL